MVGELNVRLATQSTIPSAALGWQAIKRGSGASNRRTRSEPESPSPARCACLLIEIGASQSCVLIPNGWERGLYQTKTIHPLSPGPGTLPQQVETTLWSLFVAVGDHWGLGDDPTHYHLRFRTFLRNRIDIDPLYAGYYRDGAALVTELIAAHGPKDAFEKVFTAKPRIAAAGIPSTPLEALQRFVANEFITLRLALGGFKAFGAVNYNGYFGGANIAGEPVPYRVRT